MRSRGGGVGLLQTIPAGSPLEVPGVGVEPGLGLDTMTAGVGPAVGEDELDPHRASSIPAAATPNSTTGLRFMGPSSDLQEVE
jgi:hypothetical protein